jgi:hypothetical protein
MRPAEIVLSILTFALVIATGIYAWFTFIMMQTANRAEMFSRMPTIGIQIISVAAFDMRPSIPEPIVMVSVNITNLGATPLLDIEVDGALFVGDHVDKKLVFPKPITPFLVKGGSACVPLSFLGPFESFYQLAEAARVDFAISSDQEEGPFIDFGRRYPIARATATFKNQMGDIAVRSDEAWLYPTKAPSGDHGFMIVPIDASARDSL